MSAARKLKELVVVDDGLERLAALSGKRVIICPNHSIAKMMPKSFSACRG